MNFEEYAAGVDYTWKPNHPPLTPWQQEVCFCETGLSGETGEISEMVKKGFFHGLPHLLEREKILKELGDILYYVTKFGQLFDIPLEEIATTNNQKLKARYPNGFVLGGGIRTGDGA